MGNKQKVELNQQVEAKKKLNAAQRHAITKTGIRAFTIVEIHDDNDMAIRDTDTNFLYVVTTEGLVFKQVL